MNPAKLVIKMDKYFNHIIAIILLVIGLSALYRWYTWEVDPEVLALLERTRPTEADMRFGVCFISVRGANPSADLNEVRRYCNQFR